MKGFTFQNQAWPTPEIFIRDFFTEGLQDSAAAAFAIVAMTLAAPVNESLSDGPVTAGFAIESMVVNAPGPRTVSDGPVTAGFALDSMVVRSPEIEPLADGPVTAGVALQSMAVYSAISEAISDGPVTAGVALQSMAVNPSPSVATWAAQVVTNGGAAPSDATKSALSVFYNAIQSAGLLTKIKSLNCLVPDSLIAAQTPLIAVAGNVLWTNHNFVGGDLTVNGLQGDGSTKYLETGVTPSGTLSSLDGLTAYVSINPSAVAAEFEMGCSDAAGFNAVYLAATFVSASYFDCHNSAVGQGRLTVAAPIDTGYFSGNRTASNLSTLYAASSTFAHASAGSIVTDGGAEPASQVFAFGLSNTGTLITPTSKTLSLLAIHLGFTSAESLALYNATQALRTMLGGGFV